MPSLVVLHTLPVRVGFPSHFYCIQHHIVIVSPCRQLHREELKAGSPGSDLNSSFRSASAKWAAASVAAVSAGESSAAVTATRRSRSSHPPDNAMLYSPKQHQPMSDVYLQVRPYDGYDCSLMRRCRSPLSRHAIAPCCCNHHS